MAKILANDGISEEGKVLMERAGHIVITDKIEQDDLPNQLNDFDGIIVRSATKVRKDLIDASPNLKFIGRNGVGLDNIDVDYARSKGVIVENTPAASSISVAELAIAHMFSVYRFLHQSNREMPQVGNTEFKSLKKSYSKGRELYGKTLGIIGAGRIGLETLKRGIGLGMDVLVYDIEPRTLEVELPISSGLKPDPITVELKTTGLEDLLERSDIISLHVPATGGYILSDEQFDLMKEGVCLINCARGGTVDEDALLKALKDGKVAYAGLDVFENEPDPNSALLQHNRASLTPHIGGSTVEAQARIGREMAEKVISFFA